MITTTLDLPAQFLKTAFLIGKIPFRACQADQRISYTLYIPPKAYSRVHQALRQSSPEAIQQCLPLVINVHGTIRHAERCRDSLIDYADQNGVAVLAPMFPAGLDGPLDLDNYKNLRSKTLKADLVLLQILDEVKQVWPGIKTDRFYMIGFSGGAQFAHRFMYIYPEKLHAVCIGAPGNVTRIVDDEPWPRGIEDVADIFEGRQVDAAGLCQIEDVRLIVGELDDDTSDRMALRKWLEEAKGVRPLQSRTLYETKGRLQTLMELKDSWVEHGIRAQLQIVPAVAHDYPGVLHAVLGWLASQIRPDAK